MRDWGIWLLGGRDHAAAEEDAAADRWAARLCAALARTWERGVGLGEKLLESGKWRPV